MTRPSSARSGTESSNAFAVSISRDGDNHEPRNLPGVKIDRRVDMAEVQRDQHALVFELPEIDQQIAIDRIGAEGPMRQRLAGAPHRYQALVQIQD